MAFLYELAACCAIASVLLWFKYVASRPSTVDTETGTPHHPHHRLTQVTWNGDSAKSGKDPTMADATSRQTTKVIVVGGGGTMGSSTALHLVRSGYTPSNITVLDTYAIPSAQSAGNDLNKIMGIRLRN